MTDPDGPLLRARPTIYNGIQMRSRLEARVAAWLDSLGATWVYEPVAFASPEGQYLPDFELVADPSVWGPLTRRVYLEVKGHLAFDDYFAIQNRIASIVCHSDPRAVLLIADERLLELGWASSYNGLMLGRWSELPLFPLLVQCGVIPKPAAWCLPGWQS